MRRPAILGGTAEPEIIPISQPTLPDFESYVGELREIFSSRQITNGRWVQRFEEAAASMLEVEEVVAVANATSGMILVAKLLGVRGRVLLPSFTFPATLHILLWNNLEPVLLDCDPETLNLDPAEVERSLGGDVGCIVPVYIFGNAPDWGRLEPIIEKSGVRAFSDAAHGLGTSLNGRMAGSFGDAEIFSLAPTKVTISGEGGLIATRNRELARELRIARNYGNSGNYDCDFAGLNARLSELHALLGFQSLAATQRNIERRVELAGLYREGLSSLPGIRFQRITDGCRSTYNYFAILIDAAEFGLDNRELRHALDRDAIQSKIYFHPPLHQQTHFRHLPGLQGEYPNTERVCSQVLCLPLFSHMRDEEVGRVVETIEACRNHSSEIRQALRDRRDEP